LSVRDPWGKRPKSGLPEERFNHRKRWLPFMAL